jgi:hypothetical protein
LLPRFGSAVVDDATFAAFRIEPPAVGAVTRNEIG